MEAVEARSLSPSVRAVSRSAARLRQWQVSGDMELRLRRQRLTSRACTSSTSSRCISCSSSTRGSSSPCCTTTTMLTILTSALLRLQRRLHSGADLRQGFHRLRLIYPRILLRTEALLHMKLQLHLHLHPKTAAQHRHTPLTAPPPLRVQQQTIKRRPQTCPPCHYSRITGINSTSKTSRN